MRRLAALLSCLVLAGPALADEDSIRIGGQVAVTDEVAGELNAVGGRVVVDAPVQGDANLAGGQITVNATVGGSLHAAAGQVTLNDTIKGDAVVAGGQLTLGPNAHIDGKLSFRGGDLRQDPSAVVAGGVSHVMRGTSRHRDRTPAERFVRGWIWTSGLMVLAALIAAALPGPANRMAKELRERPWHAALLGLVALTMVPIAAVLVMITIIGIPVGLLALVGYVVLLLVGYVSLAVVVGALLLDRIKPEAAARTAWRMGAAVLAMLSLAILARMPIVGGLVMLTALVVGVGMIVGTLWRRKEPVPTA